MAAWSPACALRGASGGRAGERAVPLRGRALPLFREGEVHTNAQRIKTAGNAATELPQLLPPFFILQMFKIAKKKKHVFLKLFLIFNCGRNTCYFYDRKKP